MLNVVQIGPRRNAVASTDANSPGSTRRMRPAKKRAGSGFRSQLKVSR